MIEEQEAKKKELQSKFKDILIKKKKDETINEQHDLQLQKIQELEEKIKKEKKKRKEIESKLKSRENKVQEQQGKIHEMVVLEKKMRTTLSEEKNKNKELEEKLKELQKKIEEKEKLVSNQEQKIESQRKKIASVHDTIQKDRKQKQEIIRLKGIRKNLIEETKSLRLKVKNQPKTEDSFKQKYEKEKEIKENVIKELRHYKSIVNKQTPKTEIQKSIQILTEQLTIDTVSEYLVNGKIPFGPLTERISKILKLKMNYNQVKTKEYLYGYTIKTKEGWFFVDLNYDLHPIVGNKEGYLGFYQLKNELPTKAERMENGTIAVLRQYKPEEKYIKETSVKSKKVREKEEKQEYVNFGNYTVLIVGSRNKAKYVERLKKHGLDVIWHDAYEENEKRIDDKVAKADVVIVCTSHTSHSAIDHIPNPNLDSRVQEIEVDNEESIVARVRYVIVNHIEKKECKV